MYRWNNEKKLSILKVSGEGNRLVYEVNTERAQVILNNNEIHQVVFEFEGKQSVIASPDCHHLVVGEGNTQRDVYHYLKPDGPAPTLRLGITRHCSIGTWSSLPHNFELRPEPGFEEVFFYILEGGSQRALQTGRGMWCDGSTADSVWPVFDKTFSTIPMGYHAVVGEPGVRVSYVWAYVVKKKEWEKI